MPYFFFLNKQTKSQTKLGVVLIIKMNCIQNWKCLPPSCLKEDFFFSIKIDVLCRTLVEFKVYLSQLGIFSVNYFVRKNMYLRWLRKMSSYCKSHLSAKTKKEKSERDAEKARTFPFSKELFLFSKLHIFLFSFQSKNYLKTTHVFYRGEKKDKKVV